jgi:hypothetical protein
MIDLDLFKPWTDHLNFGHRQWFAKSIEYILLQGYELHETNNVTVWDGKPMTFKKGDCYIVASRAIRTESLDLRPGILLQSEVDTFEASISVNTPLEVVFCAVKYLSNED